MLNLVLRTWPSRRTTRFSVTGMVCGVMTTGPTGGRTRLTPGASGPDAPDAVTGPGGGTSPAGLVTSGGVGLFSSGLAGVATGVSAPATVSAGFGSGSLFTGFGGSTVGSTFG